MAKSDSTNLSMKQTSNQCSKLEITSSQQSDNDNSWLLQQRLELVEDLWQTVLRSECPQ